ncbi:MAG: putative LPS assembly protein LptD [Cyclobacteriaceae bacterium]
MKYAFLVILLCSFCAKNQAQNNENTLVSDSLQYTNSDTTITVPDSVIANPEYPVNFVDSLGAGLQNLPSVGSLPDSLIDASQLPDSTALTGLDSIYANQPRGDISTTIEYSAVDSIYFDMRNQNVYLYGASQIDYGSIKLEADRIKINWVNNEIEADYSSDSTGQKIGKPIFTDQGQSYETDEMTYNFRSRKAIIQGIITQQGEAYVQGETVKKNEDDELFIRNAKYTTCNLANPHFHISSRKLKAIPGNKVISGPFNLAFQEVETPLGFFFGMFPQPRKKTSGVIVPSYGEENRRGFFLKDGGYYWAASDYADFRVTADIYSKGGYSFNVNNNYKKRYSHAGGLRFSYNRFLSDEPSENIDTKDFSLNWAHNPQSKGTSRFSSSVNIRTNSYNQNNNLVDQDFNQSISAQFSSNVSYSKTFKGTPFNISTNLRHNQNVQTKAVTITAPEFTSNMNRIYPFKNVRSLNRGILGKLSFSHNFSAKNDISNAAVPKLSGVNVVNRDPQFDSLLAFNSENFGAIMERAKIGGIHKIPISTSFTALKFLTLSPNLNYNELWYTRELKYTYDSELQGVKVDTLNGFSRAGYYDFGMSLNTRLYGFFPINGGKVEAIRHVLTPQIGFSYSPDFTKEKFGYYQEVQVDESGKTDLISKYNGFIYGSPPQGENASLNLTLNNNVEMKVRSKRDSTGKAASKKIKIFDNLSFSSGYNFLADSFALRDIRFSTRTSFFENLINVNVQGTIDPYVYILDSETETSTGTTVVQRKINKYAWNAGQGLGNISQLNTSLGFRFTPNAFKGKEEGEDNEKESEYGTPEELEYINANPEDYVDFSIPWSINGNYSVNRRQTGFQDATVTQALTFSGDFSITEKTKIDFRSGYDFENKEFTQTSINVIRDLHCWSMRFNWVPFGRFQSFEITIRAKSSLLQDLKLEKRKRFFDNF